jgi:hypothetical protein
VVHDPLDPEHCTLPINDRAFHYETDLFSGRALVMLRHLPNSPDGAFAGKRRTCFVAVQVRGAWQRAPVMAARRSRLPTPGLG